MDKSVCEWRCLIVIYLESATFDIDRTGVFIKHLSVLTAGSAEIDVIFYGLCISSLMERAYFPSMEMSDGID